MIYHIKRITIMDEPTANLDPLAENMVYNRLHKLAADGNVIFISHRLASTSFCDEVLVLKDGVLVERGSHTDLMNENGYYRKLFEAQSKYYEESGEEESVYE